MGLDYTIVVFDLETTGLDTNKVQITEIGAIAYSNKLEEVPNGRFHSYINPKWDEIDADPDLQREANRALDKTGFSREFLSDKPPEEVVFPMFTNYLKNLKAKGAPIAAGHNIIKYDIPIINRYCKKYGNVTKGGEPNIFNKRFVIDTLHTCFLWFENIDKISSYSNDNLRAFLGATDEAYGSAHSAINDVKFTGDLLMRFMKLHRAAVKRLDVKFEGAFGRS